MNLEYNTSNLKIDNVRVYGIEETMVASGLPKVEEYSKDTFEAGVMEALLPDSPHMKRIYRLGHREPGTSHDCALCGIVVQMNITAPLYWWPEFQRYHFADIISSTSTMHKLMAVMEHADDWYDLKPRFTEDMPPELLAVFFSQAKMILTEDSQDGMSKTERLKAILPGGWLQTARVTTNYRQLKTMWTQRKDHPLMVWKGFCRWIDRLPLSDLITKKENIEA